MKESTPRSLVVIAASRGGLEALRRLLAPLPTELPACILLIMHIGAHPSLLPDLLRANTALPVRFAEHGDALEAGSIFVAPPDFHVLIDNDHIALSHGAKENFTRPAADPTFRSAALSHGRRVVGVVLTGELDDGAAGLRAVRSCGGYAIVQSPEDCVAPSMPRSAFRAAGADAVVPIADMARALVAAVTGAPGPGEPDSDIGSKIDSEIDSEIDSGQREEIALEAGVTARQFASLEEMDALGEKAEFTCPECGGNLWRMHASPLRFRCHVGHAFSELTFEAGQARQAEATLWSAVRTLRERAAFARRRIGQAESGGDASVDADEADALAARLVRLLGRQGARAA